MAIPIGRPVQCKACGQWDCYWLVFCHNCGAQLPEPKRNALTKHKK